MSEKAQTGSTAPTHAVQIGGSDGTNLRVPFVGSVGDLAGLNNAANPGLLNLSVLYGYNGATYDRIRASGASADALGTSNQGLYTLGFGYVFNGTAWDRWRSNLEGTLLSSTARTTTTNGPTQINHNGSAITVWLNVTAVPGVDTIQVNIQGYDVASAAWYTIAADAAISAVSSRQIVLGLGAVSGGSAVESIFGVPLPRQWRVSVTHSGAGSFTYSVGVSLNV